MSDAMTELRVDYVANAARAYARAKADTAAGIIVADVIYQTKATIRDLDAIADAQLHVRTWLAVYLENTITEFTEPWRNELQRQVEHYRQTAEDALNTQLSQKILSTPLIDSKP